ncbi:ABC transporter substrate-binding protein [Bacillus massiliigorillae]|uniref:ABC transporter substrate-binding protein n=1 Tax=Bacillus massiliigorillae TaxID=1243664 RepID=UPI0003A4ECE2|nr:NrtA/SsuA/CpmA family ABC transporter substrate-binding protein [Bacillus massiliigorillae]
MKKWLLSLLVLLSISALVACGNDIDSKKDSSESKDKKTSTVDKVNATYVKSPLNVPSIVEKEKGFLAKSFAEEGIDFEYSNLTTGPEQTQALASGDIQFLNAVGATSVILSASNGADIKIMSMYSRSPEAFMLFTNLKDVKSPKDLVGKKVAGPKGTILHEMLIHYLATEGLTEKDIEFVQMDLPSAQAALVGNEVDFALLAGANAYNMIQDGYQVVTNGKGLVDGTIVVATSEDFYSKNPGLVKRFLQVQKETLKYMEDHYEEVMEISSKETDLPLDGVKEMYKMYDFNMEISPSDIASMEKTVEFMKNNNMIENDVDIKSLILNIE